MTKYICKKCKKAEVVLDNGNQRYICLSCLAYWENGKFRGYITTQHTTEQFKPAQIIPITTQQLNQEVKTLLCPKCFYKWESKSKMFWVTCPQCQLKFKKK